MLQKTALQLSALAGLHNLPARIVPRSCCGRERCLTARASFTPVAMGSTQHWFFRKFAFDCCHIWEPARTCWAGPYGAHCLDLSYISHTLCLFNRRGAVAGRGVGAEGQGMFVLSMGSCDAAQHAQAM